MSHVCRIKKKNVVDPIEGSLILWNGFDGHAYAKI